jgi:FkbM family methyltransferase
MSSIHKIVFEHHEFIARRRLESQKDSLFRLLEGRRLHYCDVGARGGAPKWLLPYSPYLSISLFEPNPAEYSILSDDFGDAEVHRYRFGVGNPKDTSLNVTKSPGLSSLLAPFGTAWSLMRGDSTEAVIEKLSVLRTETVELKPLENLVSVSDSPIDVLKIDVQGYEYDVLAGIGGHRPMLIQCEVSAVEIYKQQRTIGAVIAQLEKLGYFPARFMPAKNYCRMPGDARPNSYQFHGDVIFIPAYGETGAAIIDRWPMAWRCAIELWNLRDIGENMRPKLFEKTSI